MSERSAGDGADPDATVFDSRKSRGPGSAPAGQGPQGPDPEATVVYPGAKPKRPGGGATGPGEVARTPETGGLDLDATVASSASLREPSQADSALDSDETVARTIIPPEPEGSAAAPEPLGGDPEATVAIPSPGRRREALAPAVEREVASADLAALGGLNPLVAAANAVLGAVPQIRHTLRHSDPAGLRTRLASQIEAFQEAARAAAVLEETVLAARHALCALLDDAASATPWGGGWSRDGLLWTVERKVEDDGRLFAQIDTLAGDPDANADLLEFFYVCLALGYEGKYRGAPGGREQIAQLRQRVFDLIGARRAADAAELSSHWEGVVTPRPRFPAAFALWAVGAGAALLLAAAYLGFSLWLGSQSDPVALEIARLKATVQVAAPAAPAPGAAAARVSQSLADAIKQGEVAVNEDASQSTIEIRSDRLFASGSARVQAAVEPVILRVAEALDRVPGAILVTGHTDDVPIRTARFPSNWELSAERARSVQKLMGQKLRDPQRLRGEGLADSEPAVPNDSPVNRAKNRRVVIILRPAQ